MCDIYSISSCLKEVDKGEKGNDLYDDQYNNSPREGKKENENGNNNEYDHRPTILGGNSGLPNGGKSCLVVIENRYIGESTVACQKLLGAQ